MKGATSDDSPELWTAAEISIHAPMKGATWYLRWYWPFFMAYFNPRTHEGCDGEPGVEVDTGKFISIHAPMKGATPEAYQQMSNAITFQSTHP